MRVAEVAAAYKEASKEGDEAGEALFGETEDEAEGASRMSMEARSHA